MVWGTDLNEVSLDNGQWYPPHGERYFLEITEEEAVPPGVDRGTYIDPNWSWSQKLLKRLAPHDVKIGIGLYLLVLALMAPSLYEWLKDEPDMETDDEDHPWSNRFNHTEEEARELLGDRRAVERGKGRGGVGGKGTGK